MYAEFLAGTSKSELERRYLNRPQSHGKAFSQLVRDHLGIETEERSRQAREITRLHSVVHSLGGDPRRSSLLERTRRPSADEPAHEFYGYGDFQPEQLSHAVSRVGSEVVDALLAGGAEVVVTVEVRARSAPDRSNRPFRVEFLARHTTWGSPRPCSRRSFPKVRDAPFG